MCKKLVFLISLVVILSMAGRASAELILHWTFDEGSGSTVIDRSGNGRDGTIEGDPAWVAGKLGGALDFGGDGDRVVDDDGGDYLNGLDAVTIAVWIKSDLVGTDKGFIQGEEPDGGDNILTIRYDAAGATGGGSSLLKMAVVAPSDEQQLESSSNLQTTEWQHVALVWARNEQLQLYINGELDTPVANGAPRDVSTSDITTFIVGQGAKDAGGGWDGLIDDVRIYDTALTDIELVGVMAGGGVEYPQAAGPSPENGALVEATWVTMGWRAGDFAVSHDVYMSDSFDDVNSGAEAAFQGNKTDTMLIVGFPGFPFSEGLVPGTTYYWRVDEINDAEPNSPWIGDIWSFSIPSRTAYAPVPADGARFVAPDASLSWAPGFEAKLHTVYFGDNFDDVSNAAGGPPAGSATFTPPGPLEAGKTYYWRVDELNPPSTHKGDVWSFEVAKEGGGVKGEYYQGMYFQNLVLTRIDPQIDFEWGSGEPDPTVGADQFSVRWTGQVEAVFEETYTFYTNSDDGIRLWIDGQRLVNNWTNHGNTENRGNIDLVAGQTYSVVMEHYEDGGGAVAQLRWSSPSTPKDLIPAAALSELTMANTPMPRNGSVGAKLVGALTWKPGDSATSHEVYFGTDADAVADATKASPEYQGSKAAGQESLDPGKLALNTDYYWRVDEVGTGGTVAGNLWSFNTGVGLLIDDFEAYNDIDPPDEASNRIFDSWIDGFGTTTNGALAGNDLPPYAELNDIHGGEQAMPYRYDNNLKTSEAVLTLVWPKDFTEEGVTKLSLWFRGNSGNSAERMYVALNGGTPVYHDDDAVTQVGTWTEWVIDLAAFGTNLTNVNSIAIGFGTKGSPAAGGTGTMLIDDIALIP